MLNQDSIQGLQDDVRKGEKTAVQVNIELIRLEGARIIVKPLARELRKSLNEAVKSGQLGYLKKEGGKPEAFFHPAFKYLAEQLRTQHTLNLLARH